LRVSAGRTLVVYQEVFDNNITLPPKVAFDVWKAGGDMAGGEEPSCFAFFVMKMIICQDRLGSRMIGRD